MEKEFFAIFGDPVSHSKSPLMHNLTFKGLNYNGCYGRYLLKDGSLLRDKFLSLNLKGANITVPHKLDAYEACDKLDHFAKKVGVVNTIVKVDNKLYGYNTDAPGFLKAISSFKNTKSVLFLGAGGTAQSTSVILKEEGYDVTLLNRSSKRLDKFKKLGFDTYTFDEFKPKKYDLIINMTSAGLEDDLLPAPKEILDTVISTSKGCIDVIYGKDTPFLKLAKEHEKATKDGSDMLLYQGAIAFQYFTEGKYNLDAIISHMKKAF